MTTFAQITILRQGLNEQRVEWTEQFKRSEENYKNKMAELAEIERLLIGGFDAGRIDRARKVIAIQGKVSKSQDGWGGNSDRKNLPQRMEALRDAKIDLASGYAQMKVGYFGVKNYDSFGDQRTDCEYGMGPRHGSIVFSIGFTYEMRDKVREGYQLSTQEIEDALYLLSVLPETEKAQSVAA